MKNYGYKPEPSKDEDYVFGAFSPVPRITLAPDGNWRPWMVTKELQALNGVEPFSCVSHTTDNAIEFLQKRRYGIERNYSDRFLANISGTREGGNSPQRVAEFVRKVGLVAEDKWPFGPDIKTFEDFYAAIPPKLYQEARLFLSEFDFKHEYVPAEPEAMQDALTLSPLGVAVPAWYEDNGRFYAPDGVEANHYTLLIHAVKGEKWVVFDTCEQTIKELVWDYRFSAVKRFYIEAKPAPENPEQLSLIQKILLVLGLLRANDVPFTAPAVEEAIITLEEAAPKEDLPKDYMRERLFTVAQSYIGKDASPLNKAPQEYACAESVSHIIQRVYPDFPLHVSTARLAEELDRRETFKRTLALKPGCVIVSPTGKGNGNIPNGHAGILGEDGYIMSNESANGKWLYNFTVSSWVQRYRVLGDYPILVFEPLAPKA